VSIKLYSTLRVGLKARRGSSAQESPQNSFSANFAPAVQLAFVERANYRGLSDAIRERILESGRKKEGKVLVLG